MSIKPIYPPGTTEGHRSFTPPGWTGHGRGKDTSSQLEYVLDGFWLNDPKGFQKNVDNFIQCLPRLCKLDSPAAIGLAGDILFHICKQEVPNIYEDMIALDNWLFKDKSLTPDQGSHLRNTKLNELLSNTHKAKDFFEKVKQTVPRCSWNREPFEDVIYQLILKEERDEQRRKYPTEY